MIRHRFGTQARVHHSHQLQITGRVLWCQSCGQCADAQMRGLTRPCEPPSKTGAYNIVRLQKGKHPKEGTAIERERTEEGVIFFDQSVASIAQPPARERRRR